MNDWEARAVRLVKRVQEGSRAALEDLYKQCLPRVIGYLRSRAPDLQKPDYDDLGQKVMITALEGLPKLRKPSSFPAWLLRISRNKLLNWFRDADPARSDLLHEGLQSNQPNAEAELNLKERDSALRQCIGELTEKQREVIILHYYQGMKLKEISSLLGKPTGTVAPTLKQTREKLKKCLELQGHQSDKARRASRRMG